MPKVDTRTRRRESEKARRLMMEQNRIGIDNEAHLAYNKGVSYGKYKAGQFDRIDRQSDYPVCTTDIVRKQDSSTKQAKAVAFIK